MQSTALKPPGQKGFPLNKMHTSFFPPVSAWPDPARPVRSSAAVPFRVAREIMMGIITERRHVLQQTPAEDRVESRVLGITKRWGATRHGYSVFKSPCRCKSRADSDWYLFNSVLYENYNSFYRELWSDCSSTEGSVVCIVFMRPAPVPCMSISFCCCCVL